MAEKKNARRILVREPQAKRPLGRSRRPWRNVEIDLRRTGWSGVGRINLARKCRALVNLVNTLKNLRIPLNVGKISMPSGVLSVSRMTKLFAVNTARKLDGL